jgi:hypothetical protein
MNLADFVNIGIQLFSPFIAFWLVVFLVGLFIIGIICSILILALSRST